MDNQSKSIKAYYEALTELIENNESISFDAVSLKAGRGRGAIKGKSTEILALKNAIIEAKNFQNHKINRNSLKFKIDEAIRIKNYYKRKYEDQLLINKSITRQLVSTVYELAELKLNFKEILNDNNIIKLKKKN